jgi:hypothetical protein
MSNPNPNSSEILQRIFKNITDEVLLKILKVLIFALNIYPIHVRHGLTEIYEDKLCICFSLFIVDELRGKKEIVKAVIDMIDTKGREETAVFINKFLPNYAKQIMIQGPLRTVWLKPPPYRGPFDEKNTPLLLTNTSCDRQSSS